MKKNNQYPFQDQINEYYLRPANVRYRHTYTFPTELVRIIEIQPKIINITIITTTKLNLTLA